jgi:hypothetical protein
MSKRSAEERFWEKVDRSGDCWVWIGCVNAHGYGCFSVGYRGVLAHRFAYELAVGPTTLHLDHICHNPPCVNPQHLRPVTAKQNLEHRVGANRNSKSGIRGVTWHPSSKKWTAQVHHNYKKHHLGLFVDIKEAEAAVIAKRNELFTHNDADRIAS